MKELADGFRWQGKVEISIFGQLLQNISFQNPPQKDVLAYPVATLRKAPFWGWIPEGLDR